METSSRAWVRRSALAVALVVGLFAAVAPATAAPITKKYSAELTGGVNDGQQVTVPSSTTPNAVPLVLSNLPESQQSFGSAELDFTGSPLPTTVSAPGWTTQKLALAGGVRFRVVSVPSANPVPPGASLTVTITMPGTTAGTTELETRVKQSNDFRGTNNEFTLVPPPTQPLEIVTQPAGTPCPGTCTPAFTSDINKVTADLTVTSSSAFTYIARFTTDRMSCDEIPFGRFDEDANTGVRPEPFQMDSTSTSPVSKTLVLTFPRALSNLVPDNGTPHHPVCAGGDAFFPGSQSTEGFPPGTFTHPFEGLLLNCSDPAYVQAVDDAGPEPFLPMCVKSRARNAGKLVVTVLVESTTVDPRVW